jgi:hypothetical protein
MLKEVNISRACWPTSTWSMSLGLTRAAITSGRSCGTRKSTGSAGRNTERGVVTCSP